MADKRELDDADLDGLFAAARDETPMPSAELVGRVLADAEAVQAGFVAPAAARPARFGGLIAALGGWPALAGLATAAVAGITIGIVSPETVDTLSGGALGLAGYDVNDLLPSYADLLGEG